MERVSFATFERNVRIWQTELEIIVCYRVLYFPKFRPIYKKTVQEQFRFHINRNGYGFKKKNPCIVS